ncbi:TolC family protein [Methylomarinum sp. Ch1-1]|uniref:TolC family protein n=1 Tax=Methylomarinum roseum TaxID=3067653 RepID=A0AAU7NYF4_9GAMM|nr:TolC family protein [Methylomarinum sp. Ch1-1]MDP4521908.1 TolC family protein [Methylomarinum sp. Ch1-1]
MSIFSKTLTVIRRLWVILPFCVLPSSVFSESSHPENTAETVISSSSIGDNLTLQQALALTLTHNPTLVAFSAEIRAREALTLQAGLLPNPVLNANAGNFANATAKGFDGDSVTLQLSQLIELGGKRAARIEAAAAGRDVADWDYEIRRVTILAHATQAFIEVLGAQAHAELAAQSLKLAQKVVETVANQVKAGKVSPVEETRVNVTLATAKSAKLRAEREWAVSKQTLAAFWGGSASAFATVRGDLERIEPLPSIESLNHRLKQSPTLRRWLSELSRQQALLHSEQAKAIPDLTVKLGGTHFLDNQDSVANVGISIPLPVFDRNQGGIAAAERHLDKTDAELRAVRFRIDSELNAIYQRLDAAQAEIENYRLTILPSAQSAYQAVQKGYRLGKFALLDVLDTQRTLFNAKAQYLRALTAYHQGLADLDRLIGGTVNEDSQ